MSGKELVNLFKKAGWVLARVSGSHDIMEKGSLSVVIPVHANRDLKTGLENRLLKILTEN